MRGNKVRMYFAAAVLLAAVFAMSFPAEACTSVIISGKKTVDGRPVMWKNRDTDHLDNSIRHFRGEKFSFIGLVNSDSEGGEVWAGANTAGFAIMNTASYCLKNDDVPSSAMDMEGRIMYMALGKCSSLADFEHFLDTLSRPLGAEANFGCIDACGGAAWYETGNFSYTKRDVNASECGYDVVTNFSWSGDRARWKGVERWHTAADIFRGMDGRGNLGKLHPSAVIDSLSRSYRHSVMGIDLTRDSSEFLARTSATVPDLDFIPRSSTSAAIVIHGVKAGGDPYGTVVWAALGYPSTAVAVPVPVSDEDHVPAELSSFPSSGTGTFCGLAMHLRSRFVFTGPQVSNMGEYVHLRHVLGAGSYGASLLSCCRTAEAAIREEFGKLYEEYVSGKTDADAYLEGYDRISSGFFVECLSAFAPYLLN